ncbi:MAG: proton-conducting transporter membrane subunit, partial [Longimicrobiales bacterium]
FLFYLVVYTLMNIGAFGVLLAVGGRNEERLELDAYSGLGWKEPFLGVAMTVFLLSLAGVPFTGGFIGKVFILDAALERGLIAGAIVLVLTSLVSYYYYLRVAWYMWFGDPVEEQGVARRMRVAPPLQVALAVAVAGVLFFGIFPGVLLELAEFSALTLMPVAAGVVAAP